MDNPPGRPAGPSARRFRAGLVHPLSIAVAVVLLGAAGLFGWKAKAGAPSAVPTLETAAAALQLRRLETGPVCEKGAFDEIDLWYGSDEPPARLGQRIPGRSPIEGFALAATAKGEAAEQHSVPDGMVEVQLASFERRVDDEVVDAYSFHAFRYLTPQAAVAALAAGVDGRACEDRAVPYEASRRHGLFVFQDGARVTTTAYWTSGTDMMVVSYEHPAGRERLGLVSAVAAAAAVD